MPTIAYREATVADVGALARIRAASWGTEQYWESRISGYMRGELHPQHSLPPRVVFVAAEQGLLVGLIAGHLTRRFGCDGELEWLDVIPERRRTGIAGALLRTLARWFQAQRAKRICVDVDPQNAPARAFYRKHSAEDLNPHWLVWPDITVLVRFTTADRILACLKGIATGDAVGKQTETLSQEDVLRWFPRGIHGFEGPPGSVVPRYVGNAKHEWRIGETTDDTERTIAVARAIIADRNVSHVSIGRELLRCKKCVHPGLKSLWEFHEAADPTRIATSHDGCGAAIRVAPVGIFYTSHRFDDLLTGAREAAMSTHGGSHAIAAAAATAAAVSAAVDEASPGQVLEVAEYAAAESERRWPGPAAPAFAKAVHAVHDYLERLPALRPAEIAASCLPNQPMTIVPLALGLATVMQSAQEAILIAANIGGDSDSVASIAGGILGAMYPTTVNPDWYSVVETINDHDLVAIANALAPLRH